MNSSKFESRPGALPLQNPIEALSIGADLNRH